MSLYVDIKKKTGSFELITKFETESEIFAILGASGCGKSMTLKCIAGIEKPDSGVIILDGKTLYDSSKKICLPSRERNVGLLFQDAALFPNMTVEENINCVMKYDCGYTLEELLEMLYIKEIRNQYPNELSGGQKQRAAIARMLSTAPSLIMLDEPFSALDSFLKWKLEQELTDVFERFGKTVLYVSHDRNEVYRLADSILVMENGKVMETSKKHELFDAPKTLASTVLTGCKNFTKVKKTGDKSFWAEDWGVNITLNDSLNGNFKYAGYRAHYFEIADEMDKTNVLECDIIRVIEDTFSVIISFKNKAVSNSTDWSNLRFELSKDKYKMIKNKEKLYLRINPEKIIFLEK